MYIITCEMQVNVFELYVKPIMSGTKQTNDNKLHALDDNQCKGSIFEKEEAYKGCPTFI